LTAELISAGELHDAKVKREVLVRLRDELSRQIAGLDSVLAPAKESTSSLQNLAEGLVWQKNSRGEWTFTTNRDGKAIERLKPLVEAIRRSTAEKLVLGRFEYAISGGKFLNRRRF
jgi:hypothetical protein